MFVWTSKDGIHIKTQAEIKKGWVWGWLLRFEAVKIPEATIISVEIQICDCHIQHTHTQTHKEPQSTHCHQLQAQSLGVTLQDFSSNLHLRSFLTCLHSPLTKTFLPLVPPLSTVTAAGAGTFIHSVTCHRHLLGFSCFTQNEQAKEVAGRMAGGRARWRSADMSGNDKGCEVQSGVTK